MTKIMLIHGSGAAVNYSFLKKCKSNYEFSAFDELLKNNEAKIFTWYNPYNLSFIQVLNPLTHLAIYLQEKKKISSVLSDLNEYIKKETPKMIICHSMGALLFQTYLKKFTLPESIKQIILIQADISKNATFNTKVPIVNIFCPWDPTLYLSSLINHYIPSGLFGLRSNATNILMPLYSNPNLHVSSISNKKILKLINSFE